MSDNMTATTHYLPVESCVSMDVDHLTEEPIISPDPVTSRSSDEIMSVKRQKVVK